VKKVFHIRRHNSMPHTKIIEDSIRRISNDTSRIFFGFLTYCGLLTLIVYCGFRKKRICWYFCPWCRIWEGGWKSNLKISSPVSLLTFELTETCQLQYQKISCSTRTSAAVPEHQLQCQNISCNVRTSATVPEHQLSSCLQSFRRLYVGQSRACGHFDQDMNITKTGRCGGLTRLGR
jgi:hypothetical protein